MRKSLLILGILFGLICLTSCSMKKDSSLESNNVEISKGGSNEAISLIKEIYDTNIEDDKIVIKPDDRIKELGYKKELVFKKQ